MSGNPLKIIQVSGTLNISGNTRFDSRINVQYCDVLAGIWEICLTDITVIRNKNLPPSDELRFFEISTNFVQGEFLFENSRLEVPMQRLTIGNDKNTLVNFSSLKWFQVNSPGVNFQVNLNPYTKANTNFSIGPEVFLTFGLRRIK